jgi:hypothetical protein
MQAMRHDRRLPARRLGALILVLLAVGLAAPAGVSSAAPEAGPACNEQQPLHFLVRGNYYLQQGMTAAEIVARRELQVRALRFRTERYGRFRGFGLPGWNAERPGQHAVETAFMGQPVEVHALIVPALRCVEESIQKTCGPDTYTPKRVLGLRGKNTFHNGEVSNHVYGIAIDIDPDRNPCCHCVDQPDHPACKRPDATPFERAALPKCWIDAFGRYGFYWLGNDKLEDTMHFEFLGDPDRIVKR